MPTIVEIKQKITLPIIVAPMFLVSTADMIKACCLNGVMAAYPFPNSRSIEELDILLKNINDFFNQQNQTSAPWIANVIVHSSYQRFDEELALIKKYKPQIVITALGSPARVLPAVKEYGGLVFADVSNVAFAKKAIAAGVDGLILLCAGAGGHTGYMNPFAFLSEIKKIYNGLVIVAGGINTAKEIKALEFLGADLVYIGTHFIPTKESAAPAEQKQMIIDSNIDDIIATNVVTGVNANFLKASLEKAHVDLNQVVISKKIDFTDRYTDNAPKAWKDIWSAGHGAGGVTTITTCEEKIKILKNEYFRNDKN